MTSILEKALGPEFARLHPRLREQYGFTSRDDRCFRARGVMDSVWRGRWFMVPFLAIGATRRVMFPDTGSNVPFTVCNYAYVDSHGRETLTWTRDFEFRRTRRFDETLVYSDKRARAVIYAGTHQHVAVDLVFSVGARGELLARTGAQRLFAWGVRLPMPMLFCGVATVCESYSDQRDRFEIEVSIINSVFGRIFGYRGHFQGGVEPCGATDIPPDVRPIREQRRG
jgi:hypothetical protein